ncbi:MAG: ceramidase domain-containing protein [Pseudomonadota bacterium]
MEELTRHIDSYCERTDPSYWSEPINAVTNLAFIIAALVMWRRTARLPLARSLCVILFAIGIGSYLFHTHGQVWAAIADTTPILLFILVYIFAINLHVWMMRPWPALALTAAFIPYAALTIPLWSYVPVFGVSAGYMPVPTLILIYAALLWSSAAQTARGLATGAGILLVSLLARSVDETFCAAVPIGTHFLWHCLNGLMLGWMIEVYRRHHVQSRPDLP